MGRLNQLLAVEKTVRQNADRGVTDAYHKFQKPALFTGQTRTYEPMADDGVRLPSESQNPIAHGLELLTEALNAMIPQWDLEASKDASNRIASADLPILGLTNVPGTTLLYLEKQLEYVRTIVSKLPTLDPAVEWEYDSSRDMYKSAPVETLRGQKTPRSYSKAKATDKHPEQVEFYWEDVPVGTWTTVRLSTAFSPVDQRKLMDRVNTLYAAVKKAREEANMVTAVEAKVGAAIRDFLLGS